MRKLIEPSADEKSPHRNGTYKESRKGCGGINEEVAKTRVTAVDSQLGDLNDRAKENRTYA
jgi:hypothetical protein